MALFDTIRAGASGSADDYEIERSLRFNVDDGTQLTRTPSSAGNQKTWTFSVWLKRGKLSTSLGYIYRIDGSHTDRLEFDSSDRLFLQQRDTNIRITTQTFRDPLAWYHIVIAMDTTQSTADNRTKVYVNGEEVTAFDTKANNSQNTDGMFSNTTQHFIGGRNQNQDHFDGYMAEINYINGSQLTPASFGETSATTGQWNPKKYTGSYGTNGFYLNFSDNSGTSATTLGKDSSGNGNNHTPSNFNVTANSVENDSVLDTPTNNWCTLNPLTGYWSEGGGITLSDGLLHADNPNSGDRANFATFRLEDGKKYYIEGEYLKPGGSGSQCKWAITTLSKSDGVAVKPGGSGSFGFDWRGGGGTPQILNSGSSSTIGSQPSNGEVIGMAIDLANGKIYVHKGNSYYNSGNPDNGTGAIITGISTGQDYQFITSVDSGGPNFSEFKINFGQQGFQHQPSSFTDLLNSQNLPDPVIPLPTKYFETLLYTGNGGTNNITGLDFSPDWVWLKTRNTAATHPIFDQVRGANVYLDLQTDSETTNQTDLLTSFNSDGFTLGANTGSKPVNKNGNSYVAWNWKAGDSTVTNSNGSISSQVRANTTAGFSIVSYTGNGGSNQTIGHGLGVAPQAAIYKNRDDSGNNWEAQWNVSVNKSVAFRGSLNLSEQNQGNSLTTFTSTTFSVANSASSRNANNKKYIAYVFSSVKGYSLVGSYIGNSSTNGEFVFCGFRPAWLMVKNNSANKNWLMFDNKRSPFNVINDYLFPDLNEAEGVDSTTIEVDFTANGFKWRGSSSGNDYINKSGDTYIFLAFAEAPFKYARAR